MGRWDGVRWWQQLFFLLLVAILLIQALLHASAFSNNANSLPNIANMHAPGGAGRHRGRRFVREHAKHAVRNATAFLRVLTATRVPAPAMPNSKPMGISSSAPDF
ncbi:uncharacterized protein [Gossypium hirsutum]|nr:uncharacterized protein LOC107889358 isoform X4 [Gossypium hirsutum]